MKQSRAACRVLVLAKLGLLAAVVITEAGAFLWTTTTTTTSIARQRRRHILPPTSSVTANSHHYHRDHRVLPPLFSNTNEEDYYNTSNEDDPERLKKKAEELREQIRQMEKQLGDQREQTIKSSKDNKTATDATATTSGPTLKGKRILVAGANGRLGSMVCRYLLRNYPDTQVIAAVHYVGEDSPTARGYARLSYEVGAEDGIGSIGAAWSSSSNTDDQDTRTAAFRYNEQVMRDYNLQNLRLVECELLDPVQCQTIAEDSQCDAVIWCATDFNGNQPRAVASLNVALLFRAVSRPTKGRVEVEGLQNMLSALKRVKQDGRWKRSGDEPPLQLQSSLLGGNTSGNKNKAKNDPIEFVLVSITPEAYLDYETPFGSFSGIKQQGENIVRNDFPSLSHTVLQFGRFDDNFVPEGLDAMVEDVATGTAVSHEEKERRRINRRDAARFAVEALLNKEVEGKTVQVWTSPQ